MKNCKYRRIGIYGISCTGKTTLAKQMEKLNPYQYKFMDGSSVINDVCEGGLAAFKKLPAEHKYQCRKAAIRYLEQLQKKEQKHLIIAGHYSFFSNDNFEIAWTDADENFYTDIIIINDDIDTVYQRCINLGKKYSKTDLKKWNHFENSKLANLQKEIYRVKSNKVIDRAFEILEEMNKRIILDDTRRLIPDSYDTFLLFDADGTIIANDSARFMQKYLQDAGPEKIKQIFKQYPQYEFKAFWEVANHYSKNNDISTFKTAYKNAAKEIKIRDEFLKLLSLPDVNKIIVSAGFSELWKYLLKKYNINDVSVISGNTLYDKYLIGDKEKGYIVDLLRTHNKKVISFGDGLVDRYMLEKSDMAFLIINDKFRSINKYLDKIKNLRYLSFSGLELEGIKKTTIDEIINLIKA